MPANLKNSAVPTGLKRSVFIPIPKKGNAKECSNYLTIALISHASKYSKFSKSGFNSTWTVNFQMFKLDLEKVPLNWRSNCQHLLDHRKNERVPEKHLFLLYWLCQRFWLCGSQQTEENSSKDGNIRSPDAGQKATVRTGHGTTDWFQIGKGVRQGCVLSSGLFNLYAEYITRNAGMDEAQAGIKISGRNINNLRYADDTP